MPIECLVWMLILPSLFRLRTGLCHVVKTTVITRSKGFVSMKNGSHASNEVLLQAVFTVTAYGGSGRQNIAEPFLGCFTELVKIPFRMFHP